MIAHTMSVLTLPWLAAISGVVAVQISYEEVHKHGPVLDDLNELERKWGFEVGLFLCYHFKRSASFLCFYSDAIFGPCPPTVLFHIWTYCHEHQPRGGLSGNLAFVFVK